MTWAGICGGFHQGRPLISALESHVMRTVWIGTWPRCAIRAKPGLNGLATPARVRVPSGKITSVSPAATRALAARTRSIPPSLAMYPAARAVAPSTGLRRIAGLKMHTASGTRASR